MYLYTLFTTGSTRTGVPLIGVTGALVSFARSSPVDDILRFTGVDGARTSRGFRARNTPSILLRPSRVFRASLAPRLSRATTCAAPDYQVLHFDAFDRA